MNASPTDLFERANTDPFDGDELRHLIERAAQIHELTLHPGWAYLNDYVIALTTKEQARVLAGRCADQVDYARATARIEGMLDVLKAPDLLATQVRMRQELTAQTEGDQP